MNWSGKARTAALDLSMGDEREDDSTTAKLIRDIVAVFNERGDRLATVGLLEGLHAIEESPWGEWFGKPLSAHGLSRLLRPYRIRTMSVKVGGQTVTGYKAEQFADAYSRVVGVTRVTGVTSHSRSHAGGNSRNPGNPENAEHERDGGDDPEEHAGDTLVAALLEVFPGVEPAQEDGGPWKTLYQGSYGAFQDRYVPLDTAAAELADGGRRRVTGAEPEPA